MAEPDVFEMHERALRRDYEALDRLRDSPEYESALKVWRHRMLDYWERMLNDKLAADEAERLRQRAIGFMEAGSAVDERLKQLNAWNEQTERARQERDELAALEHVMVDHAAQQTARGMAEQDT